jgi:hypothetical protein
MTLPGFTADVSLCKPNRQSYALNRGEVRSGTVCTTQSHFAEPVRDARSELTHPKSPWFRDIFEPFCTRHFIYVTDWETKTQRVFCYKRCSDGTVRPC